MRAPRRDDGRGEDNDDHVVDGTGGVDDTVWHK